MQKVEGSNPFSRFALDSCLIEQLAEQSTARLVASLILALSLLEGGSAEVGALGADQELQLAAVEEDAVAGGALVDRDAVARVGAHRALALGTDQLARRFVHVPSRMTALAERRELPP